jgi:hypothetical protein
MHAFFILLLLPLMLLASNLSDAPPPTKKKKSLYEKLNRYEGSLMGDMVRLSFDMMLPDEFLYATKRLLEHRKAKGIPHAKEKRARFLVDDGYHLLLSSLYYHIEDLSDITKGAWQDEVCQPDTFLYDPARNPPFDPTLNANDPNARGTTPNGTTLPYNPNFPNALYPYAQKPDGCSTEGLQDLYDFSNALSNDKAWLEKACNRHDACYYTRNSSMEACNRDFIIELLGSCEAISLSHTMASMGTKNLFCGLKSLTLASGAHACDKEYFKRAQRMQKAYEAWIVSYENSSTSQER